MTKDFLSFLDGHVPADQITRFSSPLADVGNYDAPVAIGAIAVSDIEEIVRVVKLAKQYHGAAQLHPFSTGRNWGLGSRKSASSDSIFMDLGRLDKIREINVERGYAVIEPGVTQGELSCRLSGSPRYVNVTASSETTSFLGNTLDRGVGLSHQRTDDLLGLEIVLPDATLQQVGWWPEPNKQSALYPHGVGPSLVQFFCQSTFGIVTAAVIRLLPRPEKIRVAHITFDPTGLAEVIDLFQRWYAQGLIRGVLKIYDETSTVSYGASKGEFLAHVPVAGGASLVNALSSLIEEEFRANAERLSMLSWNDNPANPYVDDTVVKLVASCYAGDTTHNDRLLAATLGTSAKHVDDDGRGWIFFLPLVPFSGVAVREAYEHIAAIFNETGVKCGATINGLNDHIIDLVISIKFNRRSEEIDKAHRALDLLYEKFEGSGFYPYRLDVTHPVVSSHRIASTREADLIRNLKKHIDPRGILAAGRYL